MHLNIGEMNSFDVGVVFVLMGSNIALELLLTTMKSLYSLLKGVKGFVKVLPRWPPFLGQWGGEGEATREEKELCVCREKTYRDLGRTRVLYSK